uniref:SEC61 translocon subunit beta n=1 Tax=Spermophilus dauricus TaxID=99837 RepID=A0A8C9Q3M0_SPEDA
MRPQTSLWSRLSRECCLLPCVSLFHRGSLASPSFECGCPSRRCQPADRGGPATFTVCLVFLLLQPGPTPSGTNVGSSGRSPSKAVAARAAGKNASCGTRSAGRTTSAGTGGMWRFYTEDSPGLKVGPVPVLVMSLLFIASVFMLHIWGKYTRS